MPFTKKVTLAQIVVGSLAILLVAWLSVGYMSSVHASLDELDSMLGRGNRELAVNIDVFKFVGTMFESLRVKKSNLIDPGSYSVS